MSLPECAALSNFTLPFPPPLPFCYPSKKGNHFCVLLACFFIHAGLLFLCPVSQLPLWVGLSHISRGEKELLEREIRWDCLTAASRGAAHPLPSLARAGEYLTALPGAQTQQRPSVLPKALDLDVKHGTGRSREPPRRASTSPLSAREFHKERGTRTSAW